MKVRCGTAVAKRSDDMSHPISLVASSPTAKRPHDMSHPISLVASSQIGKRPHDMSHPISLVALSPMVALKHQHVNINIDVIRFLNDRSLIPHENSDSSLHTRRDGGTSIWQVLFSKLLWVKNCRD
jgi:hypothetical protein